MKRLRQIAPWLGWVLAAPAFLQLNWPARLRDIEARSVTIRDEHGIRRIRLGAEDGFAVVSIHDDQGARRITLESASDETNAIRFWRGRTYRYWFAAHADS
jgi:hypothetical protein